MTPIYFDTNALFIGGIATAFVAGTLIAKHDGDMVTICRTNNGPQVFQYDYAAIMRKDGSSFSSVEEAVTYLNSEFNKRRAIGLVPMPFTAGEPLSGQRAVRIAGPGSVRVASCNDRAHVGMVLGITAQAADEGTEVNVVSVGHVNEPSWSFTPGPIFLGLNGALVQAPPASGFIQQLATAITPTDIIVERGAALVLAQ